MLSCTHKYPVCSREGKFSWISLVYIAKARSHQTHLISYLSSHPSGPCTGSLELFHTCLHVVHTYSPTTKTHRHAMYTPGSQCHDQGSLLSLNHPCYSNPRNARPVFSTDHCPGPNFLLPARQPPLGEFLLKLTQTGN